MKKQTIKFLIQVFFFFWFIWFSWKSIRSFYLGHVIYDLYKDSANEKVNFPAITLCPNPKINPLMNLNLYEFAIDKNITPSNLESFSVFATLFAQDSLIDTVKSYSYTEADSFISDYLNGNQIRC